MISFLLLVSFSDAERSGETGGVSTPVVADELFVGYWAEVASLEDFDFDDCGEDRKLSRSKLIRLVFCSGPVLANAVLGLGNVIISSSDLSFKIDRTLISVSRNNDPCGTENKE